LVEQKERRRFWITGSSVYDPVNVVYALTRLATNRRQKEGGYGVGGGYGWGEGMGKRINS
jgi:hypothetical protein